MEHHLGLLSALSSLINLGEGVDTGDLGGPFIKSFIFMFNIQLLNLMQRRNFEMLSSKVTPVKENK